MPTWNKVALASEIPPRRPKRVICEDLAIAIFNVEGNYYAVSNVCPHASGPLVEGFTEDCRVICPWHGWSFPLDPEEAPHDGLARYRVKIEDGAVYVQLPELPPGTTGLT